MFVLPSCRLQTVYSVFLVCQRTGLFSFSPRRANWPEVKVSRAEIIKPIYYVFFLTVCRKLKVTAWGKIPLCNIRNQVAKKSVD
jgi:molybdenum cofactor biosynthesis enzyme MoaA